MNQKVLWNDNWYFAKTLPNVTWEEQEKWREKLEKVDLPHDWLIYNTLDLYENSIGWYVKEFVLEEAFAGCESTNGKDVKTHASTVVTAVGCGTDSRKDGRIILRFEGVYMDSTVYVNGQKVGDWKYGYSTFEWDITDYLHSGKNEVVVKVVHLAPNSRWYSGAGIYRNVWLISVPKVHIPSDGIYVTTVEKKSGYELLVDTEIEWGVSKQSGAELQGSSMSEKTEQDITIGNVKEIITETDEEQAAKEDIGENYALEYTLLWEDTVVFREKRSLTCGQEKINASFFVENPNRWDMAEPNLYQLEVRLLKIEESNQDTEEEQVVSAGVNAEKAVNIGQSAGAVTSICQKETVRIGFRTITFLPEKGFLLNGRKVRLNGACDHHDLGALGAVFNKEAMRRKFLMMRSMGVNALRTSHNMPAVEVMELADELGFLVVSEAFDMWEISKNPYDYGRFFVEWAGKDVRSWIRRDRNHPSVIMWSIGNEIPDTHADAHGQEIARRLLGYVREWDYRGNAPVTIGSNFMPWENAQKCADIVKMAGYNYAEKYYEEHHAKYPDWVIYGSETSSVVQSRGVYHFPLERGNLIEEDEQCSALGNSTTSWAAKNAEYCITMDRNTEYSCGQFIWTAFDYIGEPTPYQTKNSYFGQIDTAGFPKDSYYLYQAEWTDYKENPMVHVYPYWDFNPGQLVDIRVCSNAPLVELFVNGVSMGQRSIDHKNSTELQPSWKVAYDPGSICAVAYDEEGKEIARKERHSFGDTARLVLKADKQTMLANGEDMIFVEITAEDSNGYPVENAADYVQVSVSGAGRLVGLDNGDSADYDQYKGTVRKLFQGKLLAMIAAKTEPGEITIKVNRLIAGVDSDWCLSDIGSELQLQAVEAPVRQGIVATVENAFMPLAHVEPGFVPVRKVELSADTVSLSPEQSEVIVQAKLSPARATDKDLIWKVVDAAGMESRIAKIEPITDSAWNERELAGAASGMEVAVSAGKGCKSGQNGIQNMLHARVTGLGDGEFYVRCMTKNGTDKVKLISQLDMKIEGMGAAFMSPYEMVAGASYSAHRGDIGSGPSNSAGTEKGVETWLTYTNLDFGSFGSDEITLSIFANDSDPHKFQIWEGTPGEAGSELLGDVIYQKPGMWEVFQPETYRLKRRVEGIITITIVAYDKLLLEGFHFRKLEKAYEKLEVAHTGVIYGDSYKMTADSVEEIGNNVSVQFEDMDFGEKGTAKITICGRTPLPQNTIQLRVNGDSESVQVLSFPHSEEYICETFEIERVCGQNEVVFVFLPGCNFDFKWFKFEKDAE